MLTKLAANIKFVHSSSNKDELSLNTEFELPMFPLSSPKVCAGV
jgi:hypothetical protein